MALNYAERQWLPRKLFSQRALQKGCVIGWFFNGNVTSLQSEGACATSPSPLPCVSVKTGKNSQETKGRGGFFTG